MRKCFYVFVVIVVAFGVTGCQNNKTRVAEGAGVGGVLGAIAGGVIGHQSGHGVEGALIGGAVGAAGGATVGSQINKPTQNTEPQKAAVSATPGLTMQQVVDLTKQGVSSDEIIAKIKAASPKYSLTADDIDYLKKQGVSQRVIETMQEYK